jgi:hypothetical protein
LLAVVGFIAFPASSVKASGPTGSWASGIACQNLDNTNAASVTISFYQQMNATDVKDYSVTIPAGGSYNWFTLSGVSMPGFPTSFTGSGVVSSTTPLACTVNTQSGGTGTLANPYRLGANMGLSDKTIGPAIYIPQAVKFTGVIYSYLAVQNTGSANDAVTVRYYGSDGNEIVAAAETATIPANASQIFYQADNANLPGNFNGSAKVSSNDGTTPLGVAVAMYYSGTSNTTAGFLSFNGVPSGSGKAFVPSYYRKFAGYNSGLAVQNVGSAATVATATFTCVEPSPIGVQTLTKTSGSIAPNTSWLVFASSATELAPIDNAAWTNKNCSVVVTVANPATDKVVVSANLTNDGTGPATLAGQGGTFNAINDGDQTNTVSFPQYVKWFGNKLNSGIAVSNTTATDGTCTVTYSPSGAFAGATETGVVLPANGNFSRFAASVASLPNGYNSAVSVTCTQPVVGIVNMGAYNNMPGTPNADVYGDSLTQTTGINK